MLPLRGISFNHQAELIVSIAFHVMEEPCDISYS